MRVAVDGTATNVYAIGSGNSVRTSIERRPDGNFDVALVSGATFQAINMQSFTPAGTDIGPLQQFGGGFTNASVEVAYVAAPATLSR